MKLTFAFVAAVTAANHGIEYDHHENGMGIQTQDEVVNEQNVRPDGQIGSNFNQVTRSPTIAPKDQEHEDGNNQGDTEQIDEQDDVISQPTVMPTSFPTKIQTTDKGSQCAFYGFKKPVGWVGSGPGKEYCNIWKCEKSTDKFTKGAPLFKKSVRTCSVEEHGSDFCSHTTCTFETNKDSGSKKVIMVHSDHREEVGGRHQCGFSKHAAARGAARPGCDCICSGNRRQDANGFRRNMHEITSQYSGKGIKHDARSVDMDHDETTNGNNWDAQHNSNNFYSQHNNINRYDNPQHFANENANLDGGDGTTSGIKTHLQQFKATQQNQKDQAYFGANVAHLHIDN